MLRHEKSSSLRIIRGVARTPCGHIATGGAQSSLSLLLRLESCRAAAIQFALLVALRRRDVIVFKVLPGASRRLRAARQNRELAGSCRELPHAPGALGETCRTGGKRRQAAGLFDQCCLGRSFVLKSLPLPGSDQAIRLVRRDGPPELGCASRINSTCDGQACGRWSC